MDPLVSVLIPCYNCAQYLAEAVESVLAQTHTNLECIIVDDGSTDSTRQVSESLMSRDSRVKYLFKDHSGLYPTRNFALRYAKGEWIQFLDADDWFHEDKINFQLSYLDRLADNDDDDDDDIVFYSDYGVVRQDDNQNVVKRTTNIVGNLTNEQLLEQTVNWNFEPNIPLHINSTLIKKTIFRKKMFNEEFRAFGDQELFVDLLLKKDISFVYTPIIGMHYRQHQSNMTKNWPLIRTSYIQWLETIYERDKRLLRSNPNLGELIRRAFIENNRDEFYRLVRLNVGQTPIYFSNKRIRVKNKFLLRLVFLMRSFIPISKLT